MQTRRVTKSTTTGGDPDEHAVHPDLGRVGDPEEHENLEQEEQALRKAEQALKKLLREEVRAQRAVCCLGSA